jgi:hypothetical protein
MASKETQNTAVSFQPTCAILVPITIVVPANNNTPQKILTSTQLPVWARMAPAIGLVVRPGIEVARNTRPDRYPISRGALI